MIPKWMTAENVISNVKRYARNGSIITFHDSLKSIDKLRTALPESIKWPRSKAMSSKPSEGGLREDSYNCIC